MHLLPCATTLAGVLVLAGLAAAQVKGTPVGFGKEVTGGGSAAAATPTSLDQFVSVPFPWLSLSRSLSLSHEP